MKAAKRFAVPLVVLIEEGSEEQKEKARKIVECFALCVNYKYRQCFVKMMSGFAKAPGVFDVFAGYLSMLAKDKVSIVRISLAKLIRKIMDKEEFRELRENEKVISATRILLADEDRQVKEILGKMEMEGTPEEFDNQNFVNDMLFIETTFGKLQHLPIRK